MIDFIPFLVRNRYSVAWPRITKFLSDLRADKKTQVPVGIAGFCWGGLHAVKLSHDTLETRTADGKPLADAFFTAHPSNLSTTGDFDGVQRPLSVAIGDEDDVWGMKEVEQAKAILATKSELDTEVVVYPGAKHGFSVRASRAVPDSKETRQAEEAERQSVAWFKKHFAAVQSH